jgi:hypothetical protein
MFVGSPTNIRATWGRCGWSGLPRGSYVRRGTDEHKGRVAAGLRDVRVLGSSVPHGRRI